MVSVKEHLFRVRDEGGVVEADVSLSKGDLVMIAPKHTWQGGKPPLGIFKGVKENVGDGQSCVLLEVPDRICGYDMPRLQTQVIQFGLQDVDHIQLLAGKSLAASILFEEIGRLLVSTTDLKARAEKATEALNSQH